MSGDNCDCCWRKVFGKPRPRCLGGWIFRILGQLSERGKRQGKHTLLRNDRTRKVAKSRIVDYAIYITCGLMLSVAAYLPVYLGKGIRPMLPKVEASAICLTVVGFLGYELREWAKLVSLWIYFSSVVLIQVLFLWCLFSRGITLNVLTWVVLASAEVFGFSFLYRMVAGKPRSDSR